MAMAGLARHTPQCLNAIGFICLPLSHCSISIDSVWFDLDSTTKPLAVSSYRVSFGQLSSGHCHYNVTIVGNEKMALQSVTLLLHDIRWPWPHSLDYTLPSVSLIERLTLVCLPPHPSKSIVSNRKCSPVKISRLIACSACLIHYVANDNEFTLQ